MLAAAMHSHFEFTASLVPSHRMQACCLLILHQNSHWVSSTPLRPTTSHPSAMTRAYGSSTLPGSSATDAGSDVIRRGRNCVSGRNCACLRS